MTILFAKKETRVARPILVFLLMSVFATSAFAQGFDEHYEVYQRDHNGDGYADLYVRQKPQVVLVHWDIAVPIVLPPPVGDFLLIQDYVNQTFTITEPPNGLSLSGWQLADMELAIGDFNVDGATDALLKGVEDELYGMLDQVLYASGASGAIPTSITKVDEKFQRFARDAYGWTVDSNYLEDTKVTVNTPSYTYAVVLDVSYCWTYGGFFQACINASDILDAIEIVIVPDSVVDDLPFLSDPTFFQQAADLLDILMNQSMASTPPLYNQFSPTYDSVIDGCYYYCEQEYGYYLGEFFQFSIYDVFVASTEPLEFFDRENYSLDALRFAEAVGNAFNDPLEARQSDPAEAEQILEGVLGVEVGETAAGLLLSYLPCPEVTPANLPCPSRPVLPKPLPDAANDPDWFPKKKWKIIFRPAVLICGLLCPEDAGGSDEWIIWRDFGWDWALAQSMEEQADEHFKAVIGESEGFGLPHERIRSAAVQWSAMYFDPGTFTTGEWTHETESALWWMNYGFVSFMMVGNAQFYDIGLFGGRDERGIFYPCERETLEGYPKRQERPWGGTLDFSYGSCLPRLWTGL